MNGRNIVKALKNNPTWKYKLWNYESCLDLLKNHYPWFLKTYNEYKYPIQRADAIRPFILYHYGGIYFDMDFVCIKNISEYFNKKGVYICESSTTGLTNVFMGSTKNHPFWKNVIEEMMKNNKQKIYQTHHLYIIQSTGPNLITKCYKKYKKIIKIMIYIYCLKNYLMLVVFAKKNVKQQIKYIVIQLLQ